MAKQLHTIIKNIGARRYFLIHAGSHGHWLEPNESYRVEYLYPADPVEVANITCEYHIGGLVVDNAGIVSGGGSGGGYPVFTGENKDSVTLKIGMVAAVFPVTGAGVVRANVTGMGTTALGLVSLLDTNPGYAATVQLSGLLDMFSWLAVTGFDALVPDKMYYISETPGLMSLIPPYTRGQVVQRVGVALSFSSFLIDVGEPVLL